MKKTKILNVIFASLYYLLLVVLFYSFYMMWFLGGFAGLDFWFLLLLVLLPLLLIFLPVIIIVKQKFKIAFYRGVILSFFAVAIYLLIVSMFLSYFDTFTESKWKNDKYANLRYLMIDDLEKKYNLIGMNKDDVIKILGDPLEAEEGEMCYQVSSVFITVNYYCLRYDDNNIIVEKYQEEVD